MGQAGIFYSDIFLTSLSKIFISLYLVTIFGLKTLLCDISIATLFALFWLLFAWNNILHPFTFYLVMSLVLSHSFVDSIKIGGVYQLCKYLPFNWIA